MKIENVHIEAVLRKFESLEREIQTMVRAELGLNLETRGNLGVVLSKQGKVFLCVEDIEETDTHWDSASLVEAECRFKVDFPQGLWEGEEWEFPFKMTQEEIRDLRGRLICTIHVRKIRGWKTTKRDATSGEFFREQEIHLFELEKNFFPKRWKFKT